MLKALLTAAMVATSLAASLAQAESRIIDLDGMGQPDIDVIEDFAPGGVRVLGQTRLTDWDDADVIRVSSCRPGNRAHAAALKVQVLGDSARIDTILVQYGNGELDRLEIRSNFQKGSESRWVDLPGAVRCIESIYVQGEATGRKFPKQATVRILGMMEADREEDGPARPVIRPIGSTHLKDFSRDSDTVVTSRCDGRDRLNATAVKIRVTEQSARIDRLVIFYGNGERDQLEVRSDFANGSESRWIEVNGRSRCIQAFRVVGESTGRGTGRQARVTMFAMSLR